jgi:hypothetical protein
MSLRAVRWARAQRGLPNATRLVLRELASLHTEDKGCFPTIEFLAQICDLSLATVKRHLNVLEKQGLILRERRWSSDRHFKSTFYHLELGVLIEKPRGEVRVLAAQTRRGSLSRSTVAHSGEPESIGNINPTSLDSESQRNRTTAPSPDKDGELELVGSRPSAGPRRRTFENCGLFAPRSPSISEAPSANERAAELVKRALQIRNATLYEDRRAKRRMSLLRGREILERTNDRFKPDMSDDAVRARLLGPLDARAPSRALAESNEVSSGGERRRNGQA